MTTLGEAFGSDGRPRENPFIRDKDGKIPNFTAIAKLTRENPQRAVALCKAAGESLDAWFPMNPR